MADGTHEFPRRGTIQKWRRDRGYGEIKDAQTGTCYLAALAGNKGDPLTGGASLDGTAVRFRVRSSYQPVDWIADAQLVPDHPPAAPVPSPPQVRAAVSAGPPAFTHRQPACPALAKPVTEPPARRASPPPTSRESQIQRIVAERSIAHVLHFTRLDNMPSIAQHGLLPRGVLSSHGIPFVHNDDVRLDGATSASCLTISWPNYKMFYRYRTANPNVAWVVLSLKPSVLWENDCAFCIENAASNRVRAIRMPDRKEVSALASIFDDHDFYPNRAQIGLPAHFPTNPQAEILLFGNIPLTTIQSVLAPSIDVAESVRAILSTVPIKVSSNAFGPRKDWEFWKAPPAVADDWDAIF